MLPAVRNLRALDALHNTPVVCTHRDPEIEGLGHQTQGLDRMGDTQEAAPAPHSLKPTLQ
jgi:hypothetical protein